MSSLRNRDITYKTKSIPNILKWMLRIIQITGAYRKKRNILSYFTIFSVTLVCALMIFDLVLNWTGIDSLKKIAFLPGFFVTGIKLIFLIIKSPQLIKVVESLNKFWTPNKFNFDKEVTQNYNKMFKVITILSCGYGTSGCLVTIFLPINAIMNYQDRSLLYSDFALCNPQYLACYIPMFVWQLFVVFFEIIPIALGFDSIFIIFIGYIIGACDLIKARMDNRVLKTNTDQARKYFVKEIVEQHDFVLDFINKLNNMFSSVMLWQFWCSLWSMILFLFLVVADGLPPKITDAAMFGNLYCIIVFQIFLYAYGGALLEERVKNVSMDLYMVNWYDKDRTNFRKDLSLMILRANQTKVLNAGKMSNLNLDLFIVTVKNALSVFTLIWQLTEQSR